MRYEIRIEEGSATRIHLLLAGAEVEFKLTVVKAVSEWREGEYRYGLVYLAEDGRWFDGAYSGGATGCGVSPREVRDSVIEGEIVTQDVNEIIRLSGEREQAERNARDQEIARKEAMVERFNALPKDEVVTTFKGVDIHLIRGEASFNPRQSSQVRYNLSLAVNRTNIYPREYVQRDGRLQKKAFHNMLERLHIECGLAEAVDLLNLLLLKLQAANKF
jgi:hypothetical protein